MATIENGHHWRSIGVYLFFVATVTGVLFAYQIHTDNRLKDADKISCANRRILIDNQQVMLAILRGNIGAFIKLTPPQRNGQQVFFQRQLALVGRAQRRLDQSPMCQ